MADRRKSITVKEKVEIIKSIQSGIGKAEIARQKNLAKTTVSTIWSNREKIKKANDSKSHKIKKIRNPVRHDVDQALLRWFEVRRSENVSISGPVLKAKAEDLSRGLQGGEFSCSTGWLERFKVRHNIKVGKISGEAADVNKQSVLNWLEDKWPNIAENYSCEDIFNGDETGLFYKMTPDRTLKFKGENCVGGKQSKLRYTVWVCANMTGSEKCKLLIIGKYERPRCMANVKNLPVIYKSNKRAWMTSAIFENYLKDWDGKLRRQNRKILLLVDNCAAHPKNLILRNIRLEFLPPNCTSVVQPMDQGIIKCLKTHYRRSVMCRLIQSLDNKEPFNITLLDSIKLIAQGWNEVTPTTIRNCFRHAGLRKPADDFDSDDDLPLLQWVEKYKNIEDDDWEVPLSEWLRNSVQDVTNVEMYLPVLDSFQTVDDNLVTTESLTDNDIISEVLNPIELLDHLQSSGNESDDQVQQENVPNYSEALCAVKTVTHFLQCTDDVTDDILQASLKIEQYIDNMKLKLLLKKNKQSKLTSFLTQKD